MRDTSGPSDRGRHACDLCDSADPTAERLTRMELDGREVHLGNGEIRVLGPDGLWYTAPTLVTHYVDAHQYLPPAAFVDGVLARAPTIYVFGGEQLRRLSAPSLEDQLDVCLRVLRALPTQHHDAVASLADEIRSVAAGTPGEQSFRSAWRTPLHKLWTVEEPIRSACFSLAATFPLRVEQCDEDRRSARVSCLRSLLESAADLGVDVSSF